MDRSTDKVYRSAYLAGWRWAEAVKSLDLADTKGLTESEAWEDGYFDASAGREKWHLARCTDRGPECG